MTRKLANNELNRLTVDGYKVAEKHPVVVVLDNIRSLSNIGSAFRTSDCFRIKGIYLCGITACPPHREIHKTSLGATDTVDWQYFENSIDAVKHLRKEGYQIISIEQVEKSTMLNEFFPEKGAKYALIFGNEVSGVDQDIISISDGCIEIPQWGSKHSFNISVSIGIVLWDIVIKLKNSII